MPEFQAWCHSCQHRWRLCRECSRTARWPGTLWFLDAKARCGAVCPGTPAGQETAAEDLNSVDCCIWNMFPSNLYLWGKNKNSSSAREDKAPCVTKHGWKGGKGLCDEMTILLRLSRAVLKEHPLRQQWWWSRSRQMEGEGSFWALEFHAGGPGCRDCHCMVNYLNGEHGKGNGCICRTSF